MPLSNLSGDRVASEEREARAAYPYVCWEHPQLYPGIMVPIWAIELRAAATRSGLSGFGRALLEYLAKLFPWRASDDELMGAPPYDEDDPEAREAWEAKERADLERETKALETVAAVITVFDSLPPSVAGDGVAARNDKAQAVFDCLTASGVQFPKGALDKLRVALHTPGRDVPTARFM